MQVSKNPFCSLAARNLIVNEIIRNGHIKKKRLFNFVSEAAASVGIEGVVCRELRSDSPLALEGQAVARVPHRSDVVLGYFSKPTTGFYTRSSFHFNRYAFSPEKLRQFTEALQARGLRSTEHSSLGLISPTPEDSLRQTEKYDEWLAGKTNPPYQ